MRCSRFWDGGRHYRSAPHLTLRRARMLCAVRAANRSCKTTSSTSTRHCHRRACTNPAHAPVFAELGTGTAAHLLSAREREIMRSAPWRRSSCSANTRGITSSPVWMLNQRRSSPADMCIVLTATPITSGPTATRDRIGATGKSHWYARLAKFLTVIRPEEVRSDCIP